MEVLTKKIMEYFDLTFLNKSDLEEHLSRSAYIVLVKVSY